jgi:hypothetical protein
MTPKSCRVRVDSTCMTTIFGSKRRRTTSQCAHETQIRIEVAGMSREVCESCGRVSVGYVEDHYQNARPQETGSAPVTDG